MSRLVQVGSDPGADALSWPQLAEGLRVQGEPRLHVARLTGGALSLGRWQRAELALSEEGRQKPRIRRPTGGRTLVTGEGVIAIALALPHRDWLTNEGIPTASFLNRAVRFVLRGLGRLGIPASYGGRDFISVGGAQAVYVSFDVGPEGHALFEAYLASAAHWWPSDTCVAGTPPFSRGFPPPGHAPGLAERTFEELTEALSKGLHEAYGVETAPTVTLPQPSMIRASFDGLWRAIPGVVPAQASLLEAAITGDVLADSAGMERLRNAAGSLGTAWEANRTLLATIFGGPAHVLLGVNDLEAAARAFAELALDFERRS